MTFPYDIQEHTLPAGDFFGPFFSLRFFADIGELKKAIANNEIQELSRIEFDGQITRVAAPRQGDRIETLRQSGGFHEKSSQQVLFDKYALDNFKSELEVEITGQTSTMTLTLTPNREAGNKIIKDGVIRRNALVVVEWGYAGSAGAQDILSGPHIFNVNKPEITLGDEVTIKVSGVDYFTSISIREERGDLVFPRSEYPRDIDIVRYIAKQNGMNVLVDKFLNEATSTLFQDRSKTEPVRTNRNDFLFFKEMLRNNNSGFFRKGTNLQVYDFATNVLREPRFRFVYYSQIFDSKTIPMQSFTGNVMDQYYDVAATKTLKGFQDNAATGKTQETTINPATDKKLTYIGKNVSVGPAFAGISIPTPFGKITLGRPLKPGQAGKHMSVPEGKSNAEGVVRGEMLSALQKAGLKADFTVMGHPQIRPGDLVVVEGVPENYEGKYLIQKTTHKIGTNGYDVTGQLFRNGFGSFEESDTTKPKGKTTDDKEIKDQTPTPKNVEESS